LLLLLYAGGPHHFGALHDTNYFSRFAANTSIAFWFLLQPHPTISGELNNIEWRKDTVWFQCRIEIQDGIDSSYRPGSKQNVFRIIIRSQNCASLEKKNIRFIDAISWASEYGWIDFRRITRRFRVKSLLDDSDVFIACVGKDNLKNFGVLDICKEVSGIRFTPNISDDVYEIGGKPVHKVGTKTIKVWVVPKSLLCEINEVQGINPTMTSDGKNTFIAQWEDFATIIGMLVPSGVCQSAFAVSPDEDCSRSSHGYNRSTR
jgi:hypothetical protein